LIHTCNKELVFALSDLILNALSFLLELIPMLDLHFQGVIADMPQSVLYCSAIPITGLEHPHESRRELWGCVISVSNRGSMNLTVIHRSIHLQPYIWIVDIHVWFDEAGQDITPKPVKDEERDVVGPLVELISLR
jgi:hypothetical protein